jgi:hypothetical protein
MMARTRLTADDIREVLYEVLEDFKEELLKELRSDIRMSSQDLVPDNQPIPTSEVCRRWGRSRTVLSKLIRTKRLAPVGKFGHSFTFKTSDIVRLFGKPVC